MKHTVIGIAGSLREKSYNKSLLEQMVKLAPKELEIRIFNIAGFDLFNDDMAGNPPSAILRLKAIVKETDAVLFVTPEYNYSIPGVLKNAIDWGSRPYEDNVWRGKPVAIAGATIGGMGTVRAQMHLRHSFVYLEMLPMGKPELFVSYAQNKFDKEGELLDQELKDQIRDFLKAFMEWIQECECMKKDK